MSLAIDAIRDSFDFVKRFPKVFSLPLIPALLSIPLSLFIKYFPPASASLIYTIVFYLMLLAPIFIATLIYYLCMLGAFPFLVEKGKRKGEVKIKEALLHGWKNVLNVLLLLVLLILISLPLLVPIFLAFITKGFGLFLPFMLLFVAFIPVYLYIFTRLGVALPLLIIENLDPIKSIKESWKVMRGNVLSLFLGSVVILLLTEIPVIFAYSLFAAFLKTGALLQIINSLLSTIPETIGLVFSTLYYLLLRKRSKGKS